MSNRYGKTTYLFTNQEYRLSLFGNAINQEIRSGVVDIRNKNTEIVWNMICRILILRHLGKEKKTSKISSPYDKLLRIELTDTVKFIYI